MVTTERGAWKCNACDHEGKTSREHLIHVAIGRVILGNRKLSPDQVRERLRDQHFREFGAYETPLEEGPSRPFWLNSHIRGLICERCNRTWARQLEEDAGENLYGFTMLGQAVDAQLLKRWAWFFAMKMWFSSWRPQALMDGPLRSVLPSRAKPDVSVEMPVVLARLDASPRQWSFAGTAGGLRGTGTITPHMFWIIRGVVWIVAATDAGKVSLPFRVTPLVPGIRLPQVPMIKRRQIIPLLEAPPASLGART